MCFDPGRHKVLGPVLSGPIAGVPLPALPIAVPPQLHLHLQDGGLRPRLRPSRLAQPVRVACLMLLDESNRHFRPFFGLESKQTVFFNFKRGLK